MIEIDDLQPAGSQEMTLPRRIPGDWRTGWRQPEPPESQPQVPVLEYPEPGAPHVGDGQAPVTYGWMESALPQRNGKVFTVASASGGCGKTFFSTNFAFYLAGATGGKVLLVDLDLQFGEVATSLHLRPASDISGLVNQEDTGASLTHCVVGHRNNLDILCAPEDPIAAEVVGPAITTEILHAAREQYDYIVVDTPPSINEVVLSAFDQSAALVVMATADVPSLRNMRVFLNTLQRLHLPAEEVHIVINKAEKGTGVEIEDARQIFPQGFSAVLPYSREVHRSLNMGVPVVESFASSEIGRGLLGAAARLAPPAAGVSIPGASAPLTVREDGWWRRLVGWFRFA